VNCLQGQLKELLDSKNSIRIKIEDIHRSYRELLDHCKLQAVSELEEKHSKKQQVIEERLKFLSSVARSLEHDFKYANSLLLLHRSQLSQVLPAVLSRLLHLIQLVDNRQVETTVSLETISDLDGFSRLLHESLSFVSLNGEQVRFLIFISIKTKICLRH
jgi:hypothetical protein